MKQEIAKNRFPGRRMAEGTIRGFWILGIVIVGCLLGLGIEGHLRQRHAQMDLAKSASQITVQIVRVHREDKPIELTLPGEIEAVHQASLNALATGYIARWLVDIGDSVKKGQLLAEIATPDLDQQLLQAQHQLQQSTANYNLALVTAQRGSKLESQQVISKQENDSDQDAYKAATAAVQADQSNVDRLLALEGFKNVVAPFDGKITSRSIDIGSLVTAGNGNSSGTALYTIADTNPLNIFVNVPQSDAPLIHNGLPVQLLVEEYPNRDFQGRVIRTAGALDPLSRTLNTEMQIANDDGALYPGMYVQLKFTLGDDGSPIVIPANAFVFGSGGASVATVTKDNRIHWQKIRIGRDFGSSMEVLSGLKDNDAVILNPTDDLTEGLQVETKLMPASP